VGGGALVEALWFSHDVSYRCLVLWCSVTRRLVVKTNLALKGGVRFDSAVGGENSG
jgi:hypothetical protein